MADDLLTGQAGIEDSMGYTPMAEPTPPPEEKETFGGDTDGLRDAAAYLDRRREEETFQPPDGDSNVIDRSYVRYGGEDAGKPMPDNQTLDIKRAARDLAEVRNAEADAAEQATNSVVAAVTDNLRGNYPAQPTEQQQPPPEAVAEQLPPDVDPKQAKLAKILEDQDVREALISELQPLQTAAKAHYDGLQQNAAVAAAALFQSFPELKNIPGNQIAGAIQLIANANPQRAQQIVQHIQSVTAVVEQARRAQAELQQQQDADYKNRFHQFAQAEDQKFAAKAPEMADRETQRSVGDAAIAMLKDYGFSDDDLRRAYGGEASLSLRDHRAQLIIRDAALYRQAKAEAQSKMARPVPQVQRPGVSRGFQSDDGEVSRTNLRLSQTGSLKDAAAFLTAKRNARG